MADRPPRNTDVDVVGRNPDTSTDISAPGSRVESTVRTVITGISSTDGWDADSSEPTRTSIAETGPGESPTKRLPQPMLEPGDEPATKRVPMLDAPAKRTAPRADEAGEARRRPKDAPSWDERDGFSDSLEPPQTSGRADTPQSLGLPTPALTQRERRLLLAAAVTGVLVMVGAYVIGRFGA